MDHIWLQARDAVATLLAGITFTIDAIDFEPTVEPELVHDPDTSTLPLYYTYWTDEEVRGVTRDDTERLFNIVVECWYSGAKLNAGLASMAAEAQIAVEADPTLGGVVARCQYNGAETTRTGSGETRSGTVSLSFLCSVITAYGNPGLRA